MFLRRRAGTALALALTLGACGGGRTVGQPTPPPSSPSPSPSPTPTVTQSPVRKALSFVYEAERRLWLYDATRKERRSLPAGSGELHTPRFIDRARISYIVGGALRELELSTGTRRTVVSVAGSILTYAWSPGRTTVAYLSVDFDRRIPHSVFLYTIASKSTRLVKRFPEHLGRGSPDDEEVAIRWSQDGTRLLVVDTPLDTTESGPQPTMYLMRGTGADVIAPRTGTQARWSGDDTRIFYRQWDRKYAWYEVDVAGDREEPLGIRAGTRRPALSPNGRMLAYDDGRQRPSVFVYDLAADTERRIGTGVAPLWLDDGALIVTNTKPCAEAPEGCSEGPAWSPSGSTSLLSLGGAAPQRLAMHSTLGADALYG